jgi:dTDP-4-dehydrorhamnose reductase
MKIYLFGSTGMLGGYVFNVLKNTYNTICINRDIFDINNDSWEKLEIILEKNLNKNDIIINCAGIIPQKTPVTNYREYIRVNTLFPHKLNEIANLLKLKFIHITTDCVYDGLKGNYTELDNHTSTNIYGISKSLGEPHDSTIIRTSIIGEEITGKKSLLEWVKSNKNGKINGYKNHYWNGVTCLTLAKIINEIIDKNLFWKGVKHIYSPDVVSKYELCCFINKIYNLNIMITEIDDKESKNMTLTEYKSDYNFAIKSIYDQIEELSEYKIHNSLFND